MRLELPQGADKADVQVFTYDAAIQTWTKPLNAVFVQIICVGAGGGGGSGNVVAATGTTDGLGVGGTGGTGGAATTITYRASDLPDAALVRMGQQAGGGSVTTGNGLSGEGPVQQTQVYLGDDPDALETDMFARANGGIGGLGGGVTQALTLPTTAAASGGGQFTSAPGGLGGNAVAAVTDPAYAGYIESDSMPGNPSYQGLPRTQVQYGSFSPASGGPGGGGGGIDVGNLVGRGGYGGMVALLGAIGNGKPGLTTFGVVDATAPVDRRFGIPGNGGPGGAAGGASLGAAPDRDGGAGANGAAWGGGGGGGGAARPGYTSGAGGAGGPAVCVITTYF